MKKVLWTAGLSNGETITEEKGNFKTVEGELSPWQKLKLYAAEKGVFITSISLYTKDGLRWNLPSAGKNPKFGEFAKVEKPLDFRMFRKAAKDLKSDGSGEGDWEDIHTCIEAIYPDMSIQVWVSEESLTSWVLIVK